MEIRQHEWLSASPHEGFEQMRLKSRPKEPSPSLTRVGANFYSSVKQQDYSASVWLRRKDKLEHVRAPRSLGPRPRTCRAHTYTYPGGGPSARGDLGRWPDSEAGPDRRLRFLHFLALKTGLWGGRAVSFQGLPGPSHTSTSPRASRCRVHLHRVPAVRGEKEVDHKRGPGNPTLRERGLYRGAFTRVFGALLFCSETTKLKNL